MGQGGFGHDAAAMKLFAVILLFFPVAVFAALALAVGRDRVWPVLLGEPHRSPTEFAGLAPRPRPNRFLMCPPGLCAGADAESPVFPVSADTLRDAWVRAADSRPHVTRLNVSADGLQIDYEARTPLLRFPDAVTVRFLPLDSDRSTLAVYSRSHYGYSDFGTNARRVREWLDATRAELLRPR